MRNIRTETGVIIADVVRSALLLQPPSMIKISFFGYENTEEQPTGLEKKFVITILPWKKQ